jgi:hypothetical protein
MSGCGVKSICLRTWTDSEGIQSLALAKGTLYPQSDGLPSRQLYVGFGERGAVRAFVAFALNDAGFGEHVT